MKHPLIFRANENVSPFTEIEESINLLKKSVNNYDELNALKILSKYVTDWKKVFRKYKIYDFPFYLI